MTKTSTKERAVPATHEEKLAELKAHMAEIQKQENPQSQLISILHKAQDLYGFLSNDVMDEIALTMGVPTAHIWGVATFYHYFKLTPPGRYEIALCLGTACYVKGAAQILQAVKDELKIDVGGVTEDGVFSLSPARCLGACGLAPVAMIGEKIHGELTPKKVVQIIKDYRKQAEKEK